jgi:serine/threonine protein kinase
MINGRPLFPGSSDSDQLNKIFMTLGTPTPQTWPAMANLPEYKPDFQQYPAQPFKKFLRRLDQVGIDLMQRMLQFDPASRVSAEAAMKHPFFRDLKLPRNQQQAPIIGV